MFETYDKAIEDHISAILDIPDLDLAEIRKREFKVVVDSVNASGSNIFPQLLNELGCTVIKLNCEPSGIFPRSAEPLPENLTELCSVVVENSADLGFAVDPDADRLAIIDETGHPIGEEYTLTLVVDFVLRHKRGTVVANVSTTRALDELAKKYRVSLLRTKVGEVYVAKKMKDVNAIIGGEGNGGVILPEVHLGRDAPVAAALILQLMTELNLPLSKIITELPKYEMVKDKVQLERFSPQELIPLIENSLIGAEIDKTDGIKFNFANSWVQVRPSNTEPIVRVFAEAPMRDIAISLCAEMKEKISNLEKRED
jgi:phosphomannomutase